MELSFSVAKNTRRVPENGKRAGGNYEYSPPQALIYYIKKMSGVVMMLRYSLSYSVLFIYWGILNKNR